MTDYFYQARRRGDPPDAEGEAPSAAAATRRNPYPPEDEAYWSEAGAAPDAPAEPLWYEDRVGHAGDAPPEPAAAPPRRAPPPRRVAPPPPPMEPEAPLADEADDAGYDAREYWTRPAEEEAGAEPWPEEPAYDDDEPAYDRDDVAAGWAVGFAAEDEGLVAGTRAYTPGASAAVARAAADSGERNIRFDPTKERGPEYHENAARHSRRVRVLRIVLPTIALLSVVGFFAVMSWDAGDDLPALNLSGINFEDREITMDKPHISGFDGTKRAYEIHAVKATQALGNTKVVTLETIQAKFTLGDNVRANLDAVSGIYDSVTQKLKLMGGIQLETTNGYKAELTDADVDVEAGNVASTTGVKIHGKEGSITSDSIEVLDRGKHVFFRGNVKVFYEPPETPEKKEDAGGTGEAPAPAAAPAAAVPTPAPAAIIEATPDGST